MKKKFLDSLETLLGSLIDNKTLFERRKNSFLVPIIIFILSIFMMSFPSYISYAKQTSDDIMKNFPSIETPLGNMLSSGDLDCSVKEGTLICSEDTAPYYDYSGDDIKRIKYAVFVNHEAITADTAVSLNSPKETDNYIILMPTVIKIRYVNRDYVNDEVNTYEITGTYSQLEGYNLKEISEKIASNPSSVNEEVSNFVYKSYRSNLRTLLITSLSSSIVSFVLFTLVCALMLKSPTLFKRKKGFKFSECLKIALTASLMPFIISLILCLFNINFAVIFALIYFARMVYVYIRYIVSKKTSIFPELYQKTKEERFNF